MGSELNDKEGEMKDIKARNSRLAAENNKIKTGKKNPTKRRVFRFLKLIVRKNVDMYTR